MVDTVFTNNTAGTAGGAIFADRLRGLLVVDPVAVVKQIYVQYHI